jgi:hypothetical protein
LDKLFLGGPNGGGGIGRGTRRLDPELIESAPIQDSARARRAGRRGGDPEFGLLPLESSGGAPLIQRLPAGCLLTGNLQAGTFSKKTRRGNTKKTSCGGRRLGDWQRRYGRRT